MRIVFVGTVEFSRHCLLEVLRNKGNVVAVITLSKDRAGSIADYSDLAVLAQTHAIPVHQVKNINDPDSLQAIRSYQPDVLFVFGWSQLVSKSVLQIPRMGCIGTHPALLPLHRGRHPLIWALVEGLYESGLTFFYLDEGADSGDILWQRAFPITDQDDAGTLYRKIETLAGEAIAEFLPQLEIGKAPRQPQDHSRASYWRKRTEVDGEIHWSSSADTIYNLIRALTHPYPGAHTFLNHQKIILWRAQPRHTPLSPAETTASPGTIMGHQEAQWHIRTGDGILLVTEFQTFNEQIVKIGDHLGAHT